MQIQKRDGRFEDYDRNKIARAMQKALAEVGDPSGKDKAALEALLVHVEQAIEETGAAEVEKIQDLVERTSWNQATSMPRRPISFTATRGPS